MRYECASQREQYRVCELLRGLGCKYKTYGMYGILHIRKNTVDAAAPDLLEACKGLEAVFRDRGSNHDVCEALDAVHAVIAKAEKEV